MTVKEISDKMLNNNSVAAVWTVVPNKGNKNEG